jgi:hypothetical protein
VYTMKAHLSTVIDGTPRDCSSNRCGSQADTAIIRDREIQTGQTGPLGRTQGGGPIDAATMVGNFMGTGGANRAAKRTSWVTRQLSNLLGGLTGGGQGQGQKSSGPDEAGVAASAGTGQSSGLPTCADDGTITMTFRQVRVFNICACQKFANKVYIDQPRRRWTIGCGR